jgi:DNA-binding winged helix-turn-helix (wHTH) protein/Tol biopolymer transport system component
LDVLTIDRVRFGVEFDRINRLLYRDGLEVALPPRAVGVLSCLIERPGQIVSKQILLDEVWKDANVTETSLTEAVSLLRQILSDDPQRPVFIQTVPRRGYRFVATLSSPNGTSEAHSAPAADDSNLVWPGRSQSSTAREGEREARSTDTAIGTAESPWPAWFPWLLFAVAIGALVAIVLAVLRQPSTYSRPVARFAVVLPTGLELATDTPAIALSRDGRRLAFVARRARGPRRLYVRDLDRLDPTVVEGTDGAAAPFFSPDGQWVGFFAGGSLKKATVAGGAVITLCEARSPLGASWSTRRTIVFAASLTGGLSRVHQDGGAPVVLTTPEHEAGEVRHAWPVVTPDENAVLFTGLPLSGSPEAARVGAVSLDSGRVRTLVESGTSAHYAPTGHLLFARGHAIFAAPFDSEALELLGPAVPVVDDVAADDASGATQFALAPAGHVAVVRIAGPETTATYQWLTILPLPACGERGPPRFASCAEASHNARTTNVSTFTLPFPAREIRSGSLSPDGRGFAVSRGDGHRSDIWVSDVTGAGLQRLTNDGQNTNPIWTPDGRRLIYASRRESTFSLVVKTLDDATRSSVQMTSTARHPLPSSASPEGVVYVDAQTQTGLDLWLLPWGGAPARPLVQSPFDDTVGVISPDGQWIAYQSNEPSRSPSSSQGERRGELGWTAMVRAREGGLASPIASTDGLHLAWSPDSQHLLFTDEDRLMLVSLAGTPRRPASAARAIVTGIDAKAGFSITRDGRVLVRTRVTASTASAVPGTRLEVVLEWFRELSTKVLVRPRTPRQVR